MSVSRLASGLSSSMSRRRSADLVWSAWACSLSRSSTRVRSSSFDQDKHVRRKNVFIAKEKGCHRRHVCRQLAGKENHWKSDDSSSSSGVSQSHCPREVGGAAPLRRVFYRLSGERPPKSDYDPNQVPVSRGGSTYIRGMKGRPLKLRYVGADGGIKLTALARASTAKARRNTSSPCQ